MRNSILNLGRLRRIVQHLLRERIHRQYQDRQNRAKTRHKSPSIDLPYEPSRTPGAASGFIEVVEVAKLVFSLLEKHPLELAEAFRDEEAQVDAAHGHQYGDDGRWLDLPGEMPVVHLGTIDDCKEDYDGDEECNA